jgi:hypothetical protein
MSARRVSRTFVLVALGVVSFVPATRAAEVSLDLMWDAPAGCPSAADVMAEVERLAHEPAAGAPSRLTADAHIEQRGARWHLRLLTSRAGTSGERALEAESCASLAHAATLVLVLALGEGQAPPAPIVPKPAAPAPRSAPRPAPAEPAPRAGTPAPPPPLAPEPPRSLTPPLASPTPTVVVTMAPRAVRPQLFWTLAAETRLGWGPTPAYVGYGVGVDVTRGRWLGLARLQGWPNDDVPTAAPGVRAGYEAGGALLAVCAAAWRSRRLVVAGCVGAGAAAIRGAAAGAPFDGSVTAPWFTVTPALVIRARLAGPVHFEYRGEGTTSLNRPLFTVDEFGDVYKVRRFALANVVGLSVDL